MKEWEQYGLVFALGRALRERRSWAGETHIQKASYFLQELLRVPLGCRFILYKHGPFSFDLRETLAAMEALDLIRWEPKPAPYGPSFAPGSLSKFLLGRAKWQNLYRKQIEYTATRLAEKQAVALERLGTALYVTLKHGGAAAERADEMVRLKPHIRSDQAREAIAEVDGIIAEVREKQLAVEAKAITLA